MYSGKKLKKRFCSLFLSVTMVLTSVQMVAAEETSSDVIVISTAEDLAKIGTDTKYPMNGDYELAGNIDLSTMEWTPTGGYVGTKGTISAKEANVFSGTFDGNGHVIKGLTIDLDGTVTDGKYAQVGLFSVIAGGSADDYAIVKNLIFTDVNIKTDFSSGYSTIGTLAGEVNGYAKIDQVAVLNGQIESNPSRQNDTVGTGGLIGECRTDIDNTKVDNSNIYITNCYNGADINANGSRADLLYAGGIIGRIAKSACGTVSQCINTGSVQYDGYNGYGIAAAEAGNQACVSTVSNCYYIDGKELSTENGEASAISEAVLKSGSLPEGFSSEIWTAKENCYFMPSICYQSSAAEMIYLSGLSLEYVDGESEKSVSKPITLPLEIADIPLTWTSSNEKVLTISGGQAVPNTDQIPTNTLVILTATTPSGFQKTYRITVTSSIQKNAAFSEGYAKVGTPLTVTIDNAAEDEQFTYIWKIDGTTIENTKNSYTPTENDLEKFIEVNIESSDGICSWDLKTYCSELPVIYIDTVDGTSVDSNTVAEAAAIKVQGNDEFSQSKYWYEGDTTIKGRGNSTWTESVNQGVKRPYKLKLASKANLLGLGAGKSKHWVLLANMIDHTNMRNELVNEFAKDIGMEYAVSDTDVVLILNGEYQGIYELAEHLRVASDRVNVFDWEDLAGTIAKKISKKDASVNEDALKTAMEQDYSWLNGSFTFQNKTYQIADYYKNTIPEVTGGFMLDMDFRSTYSSYADKYISTFRSSNGIPMFFRRPEYAKTSPAMMAYASNYINTYEASLNSADRMTTYEGNEINYTDLFDMDSLVQYWLVCEYTNNWDSMKNSTYLYKDLTGKAKMGPVWDYDWAFGNINMYSMTGPFVADNWHTTLTGISTGQGGFCEQSYQSKQWNRYLVKDPYFVTKAYETYQKNRPTVIEDMIKDGGRIDTLEKKYETASLANDDKWSYSYRNYSGFAYVNGEKQYTNSQTYHDAVASLKTFITKRVNWMDQQFTSVEDLYRSLGNTVSDKVAITQHTDETTGKTIVDINVSDSEAAYVELLINGKPLKAEDGSNFLALTSGKAQAVLSDSQLETQSDVRNTVQVLALNTQKNYLSNITNFINFTKKLTSDPDKKPDTGDTTDPDKKPDTGDTTDPDKKPDTGDTTDPDKKPDAGDIAAPDNKPATGDTTSSDNNNQTGTTDPGVSGNEVTDSSQSGSSTTVKTTKPSIKVTGRSSVKRKKSITLKLKITGISGKVKVSLNKTGKKLLKVTKADKKKVTLKAKNKKGTAKVTIRCGKYKVTKKIKVK